MLSLLKTSLFVDSMFLVMILNKKMLNYIQDVQFPEQVNEMSFIRDFCLN